MGATADAAKRLLVKKQERHYEREVPNPAVKRDGDQPAIRWKAIKREGQLEEGNPIRIPGTEDEHGEHLAVIQGKRYDPRGEHGYVKTMQRAGKAMRNAIGKPGVHFTRQDLTVPTADRSRKR